MRSLFLLLALVIAGSLCGCASTGSSNIATPGLHVTFVITGNSLNSVDAKAIFQVGGPLGTYVDLEAGDSITVNGLPLSRNRTLTAIDYRREGIPYDTSTPYTFVFTRNGGETHSLALFLPLPVTANAPANGLQHPRGTPLNVNWIPGNGQRMDLKYAMTLTAPGTQRSRSYSRSTTDGAGSYQFEGDVSLTDEPGMETWNGALTLTRVVTGPAPAGLDGTSRSEQETTVNFQVIP